MRARNGGHVQGRQRQDKPNCIRKSSVIQLAGQTHPTHTLKKMQKTWTQHVAPRCQKKHMSTQHVVWKLDGHTQVLNTIQNDRLLESRIPRPNRSKPGARLDPNLDQFLEPILRNISVILIASTKPTFKYRNNQSML